MVQNAASKLRKSPHAVRAEIQTTLFLLLDIAQGESTDTDFGKKAYDAATALDRILASMLRVELESWWSEEASSRAVPVATDLEEK